MTQFNKTVIKSFFEKGKQPTQAQFASLIESNINLQESTTQTASGSVATLQYLSSSQGVSAPVVNANALANSTVISKTTVVNDNHISILYPTKGNDIEISDGMTFEIGEDAEAHLPCNPMTDIETDGIGNISYVVDITASGNISASGTVFADNFSSTGGDTSGITFVDNTNITGDITASGNISASGNIFGDDITASDLVTAAKVSATQLSSSAAGIAVAGTRVIFSTGAGLFIGQNSGNGPDADVTIEGNDINISGSVGTGLHKITGAVTMSGGPGGVLIGHESTHAYAPPKLRIFSDITQSGVISSSNDILTSENITTLGSSSFMSTSASFSWSGSFDVAESVLAIKFNDLPNTVDQAALIGTGSIFASGSKISSENALQSTALHIFTG